MVDAWAKPAGRAPTTQPGLHAPPDAVADLSQPGRLAATNSTPAPMNSGR